MRLAWKLSIPQTFVVICLVLASFVVTNFAFTNVADQYIRNAMDDLMESVIKEISVSQEGVIREASVFARLPVVIRAYNLALSGDIDDPNSPQSQQARDLLRRELAPMLDSYAEATGSKMPLHFHLPNGLSLVRLWREKNVKIDGEWVDVSDDISSFRQTVMETIRTGKIVTGIEGGSGGFVIRGVIPVRGADGKYLGSVEILRNFDTVIDALTEKGKKDISLYASEDLTKFAIELQDTVKHPRKGSFIRITGAKDGSVDSLITPALLARGKNDRILENHGAITLGTRPIADFQGKPIGVLVCAINPEHILSLYNTVKSTLALVLVGTVLASSFSLLLGSRRLVIVPLNEIKDKINDIFAERSDLREQLPVHSKDEIDELLKWFDALTRKLVTFIADLRQADELTQNMLNATPLSACLMGQPYGTVLYCNQAAITMFALPDKQAFSDGFFSFSPQYQPGGGNSHELALEHNAKAFEKGFHRFEWMHQKADGEPIPCQITLVRIKYQNQYAIAAFMYDLREQRVAIAKLAAENARFEAMSHRYVSILNAIPLPVLVNDGDKKWQFINKAAGVLLGKENQDVAGMSCDTACFSICHTDDCPLVCIQRGQKRTYFVHADISFQTDIAEIKTLAGDAAGFVTVLQDVTQIEQLAKQRAEAEAASQEKSAFLAAMSHEIRTPMNVILGITEIQMQDETHSLSVKEAFDRIYTSSCTLLSIINNILDLSKIESGRMELVTAKYELSSLLNDTTQLNVWQFGRKSIEFSLRVDENLPAELCGDELRIKQILNNLLSNAFKYTDKGEVVLSVSAEDESKDGKPMTTLVCRVSDTGQGMNEEQLRHLFDKFIRFNLEKNRMIEGTGLGMTITQQLVRLIGGKISVESKPGKGTVFTVRLPQERIGTDTIGKELAENLEKFNADAVLRKREPIIRESMPYGSVLVVDDLETNLFVGVGLLAPYGLSVDTAMSGFAAMEKVRDGKEYDIIFMDHMMPKMDGVQALKALREMGYHRPIVALTANAVAGQEEMFLREGFDGFLSKPTDGRQLNMLLNKLIRDRQPSEVVKAARRWQQRDQKVSSEALRQQLPPQLASVFARDAEKTITTLTELHGRQYDRDDDLRIFIAAMHAIKGALGNIGEDELAALASRLEKMGREANTAAMIAKIPAFLNGLRQVMRRITPNEDASGDSIPDEDTAYLCEKLSTVLSACAAYDKKAAKDALGELGRKVWSGETSKRLGIIAEHLLHSDFDEAADLAKRLCRNKEG